MPASNLKPTTGALMMLKKGWRLITSDSQFAIEVIPPNKGKSIISVFHNESGKWLGDFPLTPAGFEAAMDEIGKPF